MTSWPQTYLPDLDPDRALALTYVPARRRGALGALWALDLAFADVLRSGREPMIGRIKLAWWREALQALDRRPPPPEPVLAGLHAEVLPHAVAGAELAEMEAGWQLLLEPTLSAEGLADYARDRGGILFALSARLLGGAEGCDVGAAGEAWALVDLARHSRRDEDASAALAAARERLANQPRTWPKHLRPIGMLAMLAARDARADRLEPQGSPARMLRMFRHRLSGR